MTEPGVKWLIDESVDPSFLHLLRGIGEISVGWHSVIEPNVLIDLGNSGTGLLRLASRTKIKFGSVLRCYGGEIDVWGNTSIGEMTVIAAHGGVTIENDVIIGSHCSITASNHIFSSEIPIRYQGERALGIRICAGAWIGAGVRVLDGVTIGPGAVVAAGAVVRMNVPENAIVAGVPARIVKWRSA